MIQEIFSQLSSLLEHLGQKRIAVLDLFGYSIRFDFDTVIMSWIVIALLVVLALVLRRSLRRPVDEKPTRVQAALDGLMGVLDGQFASSFSSESLGRRMFPFVSTLFLYVLFSNWLSVIPYLQSPTQNLNVTAGLALLVFVVSHTMAIRMKGVRGFLKGFIEPYPFMLPINLVGEVAKPLSHAFRLFGNVFAGGTMVAVVTAKIFPVVIPTGLSAFYGLFSGLIQAFVFAILAVAYINIAVEG
jgi:F-type H+-transporting ATPase subunit a